MIRNEKRRREDPPSNLSLPSNQVDPPLSVETSQGGPFQDQQHVKPVTPPTRPSLRRPLHNTGPPWWKTLLLNLCPPLNRGDYTGDELDSSFFYNFMLSDTKVVRECMQLDGQGHVERGLQCGHGEIEGVLQVTTDNKDVWFHNWASLQVRHMSLMK